MGLEMDKESLVPHEWGEQKWSESTSADYDLRQWRVNAQPMKA